MVFDDNFEYYPVKYMVESGMPLKRFWGSFNGVNLITCCGCTSANM